jgi:hypothetical protein
MVKYKIMVKTKKGTWRTVKDPFFRNKSLIAYGENEAWFLSKKYGGKLKRVL